MSENEEPKVPNEPPTEDLPINLRMAIALAVSIIRRMAAKGKIPIVPQPPKAHDKE